MSAEAALRAYLRDVEQAYRAGSATEHTYRPYLKTLLQNLVPGITAVNEPKRVACGAPDYVITKLHGHGPLTIGYVEAKDIGVSLNEVLKSDQLKRYSSSLESLVLTDYLEFLWFVNGEHRMTARLASVSAGRRILSDPAGATRLTDLLRGFLTRSPEPIRSPRALAERMALTAHMIRDLTIKAFEQGHASETLHDLYVAFKQVLIPDLSESAFADMFAQTLAYGLFAARNNHTGSEPFRRQDAAREIPKTNPFLRRLFSTITGPELEDEPFIGFVDDLTQLLAHSDLAAILADFGKRTRQEDPIVHFFETFLKEYDPKLRELRGVYYTPEPVVSYIVRSVDTILQRDFGLRDGLADTTTVKVNRTIVPGQTQAETSPGVLLLDPACGTGTFLYAVIDLIREGFQKTDNAGMWSMYVKEHLLPRIFGFELLMPPYAMAHLKLGMQLAGMDLPEAQRAAWAYDFSGEERLGIYLTNTLEEAAKQSEVLMGRYISDEANAASSVKRDKPVMVVVGNPPYSNFGLMNKGAWIRGLIEDYKLGLEERKINLDDDFIKFVRFGQWRIEKTGQGILAYITNNTYIDGITHRRMRQSLLGTFTNIYILNLHGSVMKREVCPDGSKDENVFDIQQGVAIAIFVKQTGGSHPAQVHYADLWGLRERKYAYLGDADVATTSWTHLEPTSPSFFFAPKNFAGKDEYEALPGVAEIFPQHNAGIQTKRDDLVYQFTEAELSTAIQDIRTLSRNDLAVKYNLPSDSPAWSVANARADVMSHSGVVARVAYRPFDLRWTLYTGRMGLMARPRSPLMEQALKPNRLLLTVRNPRRGNVDSFFVADKLVDKDAVSPFDNATFFPLYIYQAGDGPDLWHTEPSVGALAHRRPNLAPEFIASCEGKLGMAWVPDGKGDKAQTFGPEDVFSYTYAILHSSTYRERYAEFLKIDFPRLPLTSDPGLFRELVALGDRLIALHLMEHRAERLTAFAVRGDNTISKVTYTPPSEDNAVKGRVYINNTQYFDGVTPNVWEFHIGGYHVCEKWLKDRKGRSLTYDDLEHYHNIVAALAETMRLMDDIDGVIEDHGGWPLGA